MVSAVFKGAFLQEMIKTKGGSVALVTVRTSSTRLPKKCLEVIVDDVTAIQVVIRRAKKVGCPVILATTKDSSDDCLEEIASQEGIECFRGAVKNKIKRWVDCFIQFDASYGLLVDGDDPTFDFNVGKRALEQLRTHQVDLVVSSPEMTPGFFTYGISRRALEVLVAHTAGEETDTDVITEFIKRAGLASFPVPTLSDERAGHNLRLTIDYPEDIQFYRELYGKISYLAPGPEIVRVALDNQFERINWHRHEEFLENQRKFNERVRLNG